MTSSGNGGAVDKFRLHHIYNYCFKKLNNDARLKKENIIDDICFIYTIFGNDFVPKIYGITSSWIRRNL